MLIFFIFSFHENFSVFRLVKILPSQHLPLDEMDSVSSANVNKCIFIPPVHNSARFCMKMDRDQSGIYAGNIFPKPERAENSVNVTEIWTVKK